MTNNRCYSLEDIKNKFKGSDLKLLSKEYRHNKVPLTWKCKKNHVFNRNLSGTNIVFRKTPFNLCPICNQDNLLKKKQEKSINILKNLKEIKCLNISEYKNFNSKMKLKCNKCGHISSSSFENISSRILHKNPLCYNCSFQDAGLRRFEKHFKIKSEFIKSKNLTLDSYHIDEKGKYILKIKCDKNHTFFKDSRNYQQLSHCPHCFPKSFIEEVVRNVLSTIFKMNFYSLRPSFMKNKDTNTALELDCYSEKKILVQGVKKHINIEVDGKQHLQFLNFFHKNKEEFKKAKKRDKLKEKMCKNQNIELIRIVIEPKDYNNIENILKKVTSELSSHNVSIPKYNKKEVLLNKLIEKKKQDKLKTKLLNCSFKILKETPAQFKVKSNCGHSFCIKKNKTTKSKINCPICVKSKEEIRREKIKKETYIKVQNKIKENNGILKTSFDQFKKQDSQNYRLQVSCPEHKHEWSILKSNLDQDKWCRFCGHEQASIKMKLKHIK